MSMSNIKFKQIANDTVEVKISPETPIEVVEQLTKSLTSRGLVQDLKKSTLSTRYFYKPEDSINKVANKLIKSLESLAGHSNSSNANSAKHYASSMNNSARQHAMDKNNKNNNLIKAWANHLPFPNAEEEMAKLAAASREEKGENAIANQLARMMQSRSMFSGFRQPTTEDMIMKGEQMGLGVNEKMIKSQNEQWNNAINNWLLEASKPISQRFASEEEELAYWNSIKIEDRDDGSSGY
jgi:hypothetical protein